MIENLTDSIGERHYNLLVDALQALAGMCDGASARDGYGFNKIDTNLGKQLAYASAARTLSQSEQARAIRVVYKYKGQLSFDLPAPADYVLFGDAPGPGPAIGGNGTEGGDGRMMVKVAGQVLCIYMPTAALRAQYLQKVKDIPGRKWEPEQPGKPWSIPMSSAWYLREWLPENAALGDDVANIFASAKRPATIPTAPKVHQVPTVELVKDGFAVYFKFAQNDPTFAKLLTAVRALPERKWEGEKGYWLVPTRLSQELANAIPTAVWSQEAQDLRDEMIARKRLSKVVASDFEIPGMKGTMFPYQRAGIEFIEKTNGRCVVGDDMGLGKCQPLTASLLTPTGWVKMGDVQPGDHVIGANGKAVLVTAVYPQGYKHIYRVTFSDGSATECSDDHLWSVNTPVRKRRGNPPKVMTLAQIVQSGLKDAAGNRRHYISIADPIEFISGDLLIDPYLIGVLLGDGGLSGTTPVITSADPEIVSEVKRLLPSGVGLTRMKSGGGYDYRLTASNARWEPNPLTVALRTLGLMGSLSYTKFIPPSYLFSSIEQRIALLQGLMDTDGWVNKGKRGNVIQFCSTSEKLSDDVIFLARSLGGTAKKKFKENGYAGAWIVTLSLPNSIKAFRLERKAKLVSARTKYTPSRSIESVVYVGEKLAQCIAVDADDSLYVTDDFVVTHNTLQALGYLQLHPEKRPAVIVVPATLKPNWMIEIKKWMTTKELVVILSGRKTYDLRLTGGSIFIVNYDILSYWVEPLRAMNPQVVIADEAHVLKNGAKTARGAAFYGSPKKKQPGLIAGVPHLLPLTGTAIENRPVEFFPLLHAIDPVAWPNFMQFAKRYCNASNGSFGWQFGGASNLPELHDKIQPYYLRRTKVQVLTELPSKRRISLPVELTPKAMGEYKRELDAFGVHAEEVRKQGGKLGADALAIIERAKQAAMRGKMDAAIEWIESYIEQSSTGKLVIFCTHTFVVDELMGHFKGRAVKVTGSVTGKARQQAVEDFQNTDIPLFVGNLKAAGVGITLTRASATLTLELGWTPGGHTQAEDRVHRIGQEADSVEAYYMLALGTIEERIFDLLEEKRQTVDMVLDGEAEDRETFGMLSILANEIIKGGKR